MGSEEREIGTTCVQWGGIVRKCRIADRGGRYDVGSGGRTEILERRDAGGGTDRDSREGRWRVAEVNQDGRAKWRRQGGRWRN